MDRQTNTDDWSSLLSELGVDAPPEEIVVDLAPEPVAEPVQKPVLAAVEPVVAETSTEAVPALEIPAPPVSEPKRSGESKRPFLDRFPKLNLFGSPPKAPLDVAVSGTKPLTKPGEAFTSKKLEKVDPPRAARKESEPGVAPVSKGRDPWSLIASQVGNLAVSEAVDESVVDAAPIAAPPQPPPDVPEPSTQAPAEEPPWEKWDAEPPRRGRSAPPSMFDDEPAVESKESTAVRSILNTEEPKPFAAAAERLSSIFGEPPSRNDSEPEPREHRQHVRGQRNNEFQQGTAKRGGEAAKAVADVPSAERRKFDDRKQEERPSDERNVGETRPERGQRGSRYDKKERYEKVPRERGSRWNEPSEREQVTSAAANDDDFKTESVWDVEEESKPVERSGRRRSRHSERPERELPEHPERLEQRRGPSSPGRRREAVAKSYAPDDSSFVASDDFDQLHRNIPSWDDAVSSIIEANAARRTKCDPDQRRGRR